MIVYVDMDDVLCEYSFAKDKALRENPGILFPQSQYGFFSSLNPIDGAVDAMCKMLLWGHDVYILTAPSVKNPLCYTEKRVWVEKYLGFEFAERFIICANKGLLKGDLLVDDNLFGKGQENFEGELIHFGGKDYPNWKLVLERIR